MKSIVGDLLKLANDGRFDVIVHGCNCYCTMGAGIAKAIRDQYPAAYEADLKTEKGDRDKLGTYSSADVSVGDYRFTVVNAYTQFNYRGPGIKADYQAISRVFQKIKHDFTGKRIAYPKLGAGLAGGAWETISAIIDDELQGEDHTFVVFQPSRMIREGKSLMNESLVWLDLDQITARLRVVTSEQLGLKLEEVKPESRLIEDLNCDSLDLVELIMETEDEFGITIPETPSTPVGKLIFTRQPFRIRDLAEFAFLNQGTGKPMRSGWRKKPIEVPPATESGFTQLGGRFNPVELHNVNLYEQLDAPGEYPMFRRVTDGMVCVQLPAGSVQLGSNDEGAHDDEKPRHSVSLSSFLIDIEPVSVTAFCRFLNSVDMQKHDIELLVALAPNDDRKSDMQFERCEQAWRPRPGTAMQPVVMVSWYAADAYSRWANGHDWAADGSERSYLPTEAQWEYATQGAFDKKESVYAGVHQQGATHELEGLPLPMVQQTYGPSRFGLRHMSGTIWHWCRDWFSPDFYRLDASTRLDPLADIDTGVRSERGGSWVGPIELCRPSYRRGRNPEARGRCLGFRCVGDF